MKYLFIIIGILFGINAYSQEIKIIGLTSEDAYDWGLKYPTDKLLNIELKIVNTGKNNLIINQAKPGCSCTTCELDKYTIAKGDTAILKITLNTSGYKGNVQKLVTIYSNAHNVPEFYLFIRTYILYPIAFSPSEHFYFPDLKVGKSNKQSIYIKNTLDKPAKIEDFYIPSADITINIKKGDIINPKDSIKLEVNVAPKEKSNNYFETLFFKTNLVEDPSFKVYVRAKFKD